MNSALSAGKCESILIVAIAQVLDELLDKVFTC